MKLVTKIYPHKTALTLAIFMAIISLLFVIPMFAIMSFIPATDASGNPIDFDTIIGFTLAMPFIYLIIGYISIAICAWLYNLVANFTGGICVNLAERDNS